MNRKREYHDIPGTYVFDGAQNQKGYHLNMFCKSLDVAPNREAFRQDPQGYLDGYALSTEQREAVLSRDWLILLRLGGNIYYTFKLAIFDGLTMQHAGAAMARPVLTVEQFREMMIQGGRPIKGNRTKQEQLNG